MELRLLADHPALDFVNTIDPREGPHQVEHLGTFEDLVKWAQQAGVLNAGAARRAAREASGNSPSAAHALHRAVAFREAVYAIFGAVAARRRVPGDALRKLEEAYREALSHASLVATARGLEWRLGDGLDSVRWHIARDAVALLESENLPRVKRCPGSGDCGWLFLDTSKNATRRWCSMEGCGNRAKLRRFLRRQKRRTLGRL